MWGRALTMHFTLNSNPINKKNPVNLYMYEHKKMAQKTVVDGCLKQEVC